MTALGATGAFTAVSNCGMYFYNLDGSDDRTTVVKANLVCGYCAPNHKIENPNGDGFPETCTLIDNCKANPVNPWVNTCAECEVNFTWEYSNNSVDYTSCVSSGVDN